MSSNVGNRCFRGFGIDVGGCLSLHTSTQGFSCRRGMISGRGEGALSVHDDDVMAESNLREAVLGGELLLVGLVARNASELPLHVCHDVLTCLERVTCNSCCCRLCC